MSFEYTEEKPKKPRIMHHSINKFSKHHPQRRYPLITNPSIYHLQPINHITRNQKRIAPSYISLLSSNRVCATVILLI